jgi:preprotein translocase subunit SecF
MKKIFVLLVALSMPFTFLGCSKNKKEEVAEVIRDNKPLILSIVTLGSEKGIQVAFKKWAEKDEAAANEAAILISSDFEANVIPYLDGDADFKTQDQVNTFLESSVSDKLPDEAKLAIESAFAVLDLYLVVPEAGTLKADYLDYIKAFAKGVKSGCDKFLKK